MGRTGSPIQPAADVEKSGLQFKVARPPGLVEPRLQRSIKSQGDVVALAGHGLHPVLLVAGWCFGSEPDGDAAVRFHPDARKRAVEPCQLLVGRKQRTGLVVIDRKGPEGLRGDGSRQGHLVSAAAIQVNPLRVADGDRVSGTGARLRFGHGGCDAGSVEEEHHARVEQALGTVEELIAASHERRPPLPIGVDHGARIA